ncbi:Sarcoplasmic calcium-binding protein (SCP) [Alloactinosynnema sp. L-07]|uniref:EF-hand domain-containing protein n=1 Tax=Alloactinosynnema sp. L-07 TaxID=1653480 RepID=UPI00065EFC86|nr:EF-hand domain-containing protein [Alloactinosynnema sp. L-07]CRK61960.1 Sarcoplasmic calcium-binding protein (SCP) [Alloactinosynnema sp. L-07]
MAGKTADPVDRKIESEFEKLDLNHDDHLDWSDYETLIGRYLQTARVSENDRRARALRAFYQLHWLELLRYAGVEGDRLSRNQFVAATRLATTDSSRLNVAEVGGHVIFDLIDTNGDGEISKDELANYLRGVWQIDPSDAAYSLEVLDRDGDQVISRSEFVSGINEHLETSRRTAARR